MLDLQIRGVKTLDRWPQCFVMLLDGKPQEPGEIHEMQIPDRMAPPGETETGKGALEAKNEALACCTVKDGMEQE